MRVQSALWATGVLVEHLHRLLVVVRLDTKMKRGNLRVKMYLVVIIRVVTVHRHNVQRTIVMVLGQAVSRDAKHHVRQNLR